MPSSISHKVKVKTAGLDALDSAMRRNLTLALISFGGHVRTRIGVKMRRDTGEEMASLRVSVGGFDPTRFAPRVSIYSEKIQAFVDETGAKPHFPPWKKGTKLYKWAERRGMFRPRLLTGQSRGLGQRLGKGSARDEEKARIRENEGTVFAIAKKQSIRGLPRPGDPLRQPFEKTATEVKGLFELLVMTETIKAIREANAVV